MKDLSLHILDIVQNSIRAGASLIRIKISECPDDDEYIIEIDDDGNGMDNEMLKRATDPFNTSRTTRKVGLGLSLFKQNAEMSGGSFLLESELHKGTKVKASFGLNHMDRPVVGDLAGTLILLICSPGDTEYVFQHHTPSGEFKIDSRELKETLEDVSISHPDIRNFLKEMIRENLELIQISE